MLKVKDIGAEGCATNPVIIAFGNENHNASTFGYYHNLVLSYAAQNMGNVAFQSDLHFAMYLDTLIYDGLMEVSQTHSDVFDYIPLPDLAASPTELELALLEEAPVDTVKQRILDQIDQICALGAISTQEKAILDSYISDFVSESSINYDTLLAQIAAVPNKPFDGAFSKFLVTLGRQSHCWWEQFLVVNFPNEEPPPAFTNSLLDLAGGAYGWGSHCISNWDEHGHSDFGIRGLQRAGDFAVGASIGALRRFLR